MVEFKIGRTRFVVFCVPTAPAALYYGQGGTISQRSKPTLETGMTIRKLGRAYQNAWLEEDIQRWLDTREAFQLGKRPPRARPSGETTLRLLRLPEVVERTGETPARLRKLEARGLFPPRFTLRT